MMAEDLIIRPPMVAGMFYPGKASELRTFITELLSKTESSNFPDEISAIVVPHAGYVYSAFVAAEAYKAVQGKNYDAVIMVAPSHVEGFKGASVFPGDYYATPLGKIKVDKELAELIVGNSRGLVKNSTSGHSSDINKSEHSVEVQLPFLQIVLPNVPIVPIVVGYQNLDLADDLMSAISMAIKISNKKILLVASSDLSHYHSKKEASIIDSGFLKAFSEFDSFKLGLNCMNDHWEACGAVPIVSTMMAAEQNGANKTRILKYACSADSPYEKSSASKVVGYFSGIVYYDNNELELLPEFTDEEQKEILKIAATGIKNSVYKRKDSLDQFKISHNLELGLSVFVTIQKNNELRACMGYLFASSILANEILISAEMAAKDDYRFGPIRSDEMDSLTWEVTVLSRMKRIFDTNEIKIGKHGLYIKSGSRSGLLLPQVAEEKLLGSYRISGKFMQKSKY